MGDGDVLMPHPCPEWNEEFLFDHFSSGPAGLDCKLLAVRNLIAFSTGPCYSGMGLINE